MIALLEGWQGSDFVRLLIYCAICVFALCYFFGCVVTAHSKMRIRDGLLIGCFGESGLIPFGAFWVLAGLLMGFGITDNGVQGREQTWQNQGTEFTARLQRMLNLSDDTKTLNLTSDERTLNLGLKPECSEASVSTQIQVQIVPQGRNFTVVATSLDDSPPKPVCMARILFYLNTPSQS